MSGTPAPTETGRIFDLNTTMFVGILKDEWQQTAQAIKQLDKLKNSDQSLMANANYTLASGLRVYENDNVDRILRTYPFFNFLTQRPGIDNRYSELQSNISIWSDANLLLNYAWSEEECQFVDRFLEFVKAYSSGAYPFLRPLRDQTMHEAASLRLDRLQALAAEVGWIKLHDLTPSHQEDVDKLEKWIESEKSRPYLRKG